MYNGWNIHVAQWFKISFTGGGGGGGLKNAQILLPIKIQEKPVRELPSRPIRETIKE